MLPQIRRFYLNFIASWLSRDCIPSAPELGRVDKAIELAEGKVAVEIAFVLERRFPFMLWLRGQSPVDRAAQLFSQLRIWDTEKNNALLIYLLMAEKKVSIVVDRGVSKFVDCQALENMCSEMECHISQAGISDGVITGVARLVELLLPHLPYTANGSNELRQIFVVK